VDRGVTNDVEEKRDGDERDDGRWVSRSKSKANGSGDRLLPWNPVSEPSDLGPGLCARQGVAHVRKRKGHTLMNETERCWKNQR
jgi:hypothetical protein